MGACFENGVFLAALSSLFFSLCSLLAKFLIDVHPVHLSCLSFLGIVTMSGVLILQKGEQFFPERCWKILASRSLAGTIFLICSFYSVQLIPLGDASVLFYTAPAFTAILAKWLIKEPCSNKSVVLALVMMICVVLVMKPPFIFGRTEMSKEYILGVIMALAASFTDAVGNITLRDLRNFHFSVIMFNYGLISFVQTLIMSLFIRPFHLFNLPNAILILSLIFLNAVEQVLMTKALKFEKAGMVALVQASDIIYGYALQVCFFNETVDFLSIAGATIICIIIIISYKDSRKLKNTILVIKC